MLKITATDSEHQRTLVLEGKLLDPWVAELERMWGEAHQAERRKIVVDLKDVTAISQRGENLLYRMMAEGATFLCCRGVLTRHVVQQLERRRESQKGQ
jgi:ABC-type transporter Mla MlaB component